MWAAFAAACGTDPEAWAAAMCGGVPVQTGGVRQRTYICRVCDVAGVAPDDGSLACWLCGSTDDLVMDKSPTVTSPHTRRGAYMPGGFSATEEVDTLVG